MQKLNIGGGSLRQDGFVNIDLCPDADIKHDLRKPLPFGDGEIDEILAVHVIESFYQWELTDILKDWYRVLKLGGKMTIEFTDLDSSINMYLSPEEETSRYGRWGLHGNQKEPDNPIVYHHFVYRKDEVNNLLKLVGFNNIEFTKDNIQHNKIRDWRVICLK